MNITFTTAKSIVLGVVLALGVSVPTTYAALQSTNIAPTATVTATTPTSWTSIAGLTDGSIPASSAEYMSNTASNAFISLDFSSNKSIGMLRIYNQTNDQHWFNGATITMYNGSGAILYTRNLGSDGIAPVITINFEVTNQVYSNVRSIKITGDGVAPIALREIQVYESQGFSVPASQSWLGSRVRFKSDSAIAIDLSGRVLSWYDLTSNKFNLTSLGSNDRGPLYVANAINGKPGIKFDEHNQDILRSNNTLFEGRDVKYANVFYALTLEQGGGNFENSMILVADGSTDDYRLVGPSRTPGDAVYQGFMNVLTPKNNNRTLTWGWNGDVSKFEYNVPYVLSTIYGDYNAGGLGASIRTAGVARVSSNHSSSLNMGYDRWFSLGGYPTLTSIKGTIYEVIATTSNLTDSQVRQIESYLAIKYGSYLGVSYLNSAGGTVWAYDGARKRIFGVGRDDTSTLNHTQSTATHGGETLTLAVNGSTPLSNLQYVMMGDDDASLTWTTAGAPNFFRRLGRGWYVQKSGPSSTVNVDISAPSSLIPATSSGVFVLVGPTSDLSAANQYKMTNVGGVWKATNIPISVNSYVTIATGEPISVIGDKVRIDTNKNGLQDAGETGLVGVTVNARSCEGYSHGVQLPVNYVGNVLKTTTTNSNGEYSLTVTPGSYYLEYIVPSGYRFTQQHVGGYGTNSSTNSDASQLSAATMCYNLAQGATDTTTDAGVYLATQSSCDMLGVDLRSANNIAPQATVTARSVSYGSIAAITDGNTSSAGTLDYAYHSNSTTDEWINFQFAGDKTVSALKIYNRIGCCSNRLTNNIITLYDGSNNILYQHILGNTDSQFVVDVNFKQLGKMFSNVRRIKLHSQNGQPINLREVMILEDSTGSNQLYALVNEPFTLFMGGYGNNALITRHLASNPGSPTTIWSENSSFRNIKRSQSLTLGAAGTYVIKATIDGVGAKIDYYNNPSINSLTCPYRTISPGVFCAEPAPLAPYKTDSISMNTSSTTIGPISYCAPSSSYTCTPSSEQPNSALIQIDNTCEQSITVVDKTQLCNTVVNDVSATECTALLDFYTSTSGASWSTSTNWSFINDNTINTVCDRYGVICSGGHITQINLPNNNVGGTLPSSMSALTYLTNFDLNTNPIAGTLPTGWSSLINMQYFNINQTNIGGLLPSQWSTWTKIKGFWCGYSKITGGLPTQRSSWNLLETFNCANPQSGFGISGELPSSWSTMTQLQNFYIENNLVSGIIPSSWSSMTNLRNFSITNNTFDGPIPSVVQSRTLLNINGYNSALGNNCLGTGNVNGSLLTWMDSRFRGDNTTSWNNGTYYGRRTQKKCSVDIRISNVNLIQGDLVNGASATYSVTVENLSPTRRSYTPQVVVSLSGGILSSGSSTVTLNYNSLSGYATQTLTFVVTKGSGVAVGTKLVTNNFVLQDATITDGVISNNSATHSLSVKGSVYSICNHESLTIPSIECEALGDLYTSTAGSNWTRKDNWMTSPDVNSWFGVTTTTISGQQYVYHLCMHRDNSGNSYCSNSPTNNNGNNMVGPLPSTIGNLSYLGYLIMPYNQISGGIPTTIDQLDRMTHIYLNNNNLSGPLPSTIGGMDSLQWLYLYTNNINGSIPASIGNLPNIIYIHLGSNNISGPLPDMSALNRTLQYLVLYSNQITGPIPSWIYSMTNLQYLYLGGNPITGTLSSSINNLVKLTNLMIYDAQMSGPLPAITIPTLQYFQGYSNSFTSLPSSLPSSLKELLLYSNSISGTLPSSWSNLTNLTSIHLGYNSISGTLPSSWSTMNSLLYLYLRGNTIEGTIPTSWLTSGMTSLQAIGLGANNLGGPIPAASLQSKTSLTTNINNMIGQNCFSTSGLTTGQEAYLDQYFDYDSAPGSYWHWRSQKSCGTDLELVSLTASGNLTTDSTITYTVTIRNNGPRTSYSPTLTIALANGLQFSDQSSSNRVVSLSQLDTNQSVVVTYIVNKQGIGSSTINYTNSFTISDPVMTDTESGNNTKTHSGTAKGSNYSICTNPALSISQLECEALGDLYTSTAGSNWTRKDNWLTSTDVNTWFGVTVVNGSVTRICLNRDASGNALCSSTNGGLGANNLIGTLPNSIGNLPNLQYFMVGYNAGLTGPIPNTIDQLDNLTNLYIHNTSISGPLPSTIGGMEKLAYFYAWNTNINGSLPSTLKDLPLIVSIQLYNNQLTGTIPDLSTLNKLTTLYLHGNSGLNGGIPTWLGNMTNLQYLYLNHTSLGGLIPTQICTMSSLKMLFLHSSLLTGAIPSCIWNMSSLTHLYLYSNDLEGTIPESISNMTSLQHLYLGNNSKITGQLPQSLGTMSQLRGLYLPNMSLIGSLPTNIINLPLERFQVEGNKLDRDLSSNAILSAAQLTWYNSLVPAGGGYINRGSQGDITGPLLGSKARRLPLTPSFNYLSKPFSTIWTVGPNGTSVPVVSLGGSPDHVGYDSTYHNLTLQNGKTYTLSFWARTVAGTRSIDPGFTNNANDGGSRVTFSLDTTWKLISVSYTYSSIGGNPRIFINQTLGGGDFYYYDPVVAETPPLSTDVRTTTIPYATMVYEGSDFATAGYPMTVAGGGVCSNLTITPNAQNDKGLIAYYSFDEDDATDKSNNGRNGANINAVGFTEGYFGRAANFDGGNKYFTISGTPKLANFTLSARIYNVSGGDSRHSILRDFWEVVDTQICFWSYDFDNDYWRCSASGVLPYNTRSHVTTTWDGSVIRHYVNGVLVWTDSNPSGGTSQSFYSIGGYGGRQMKGYLDELRIYDRVLSSTEITNLATSKLNISTAGSYNGCYITTKDRANNSSNAVRLGDFTATFSPYSICNQPGLTVPQSECTALMDFYTATNGSGWTANSNWGTTTNVDNWDSASGSSFARVTVTNGRVTELHTYANKLVGTTDLSMICNLPYLNTLGVRTNSTLNLSLPSCIGNLTGLTYINLYYNKLSGVIPSGLYNLTGLTYLNLFNYGGPGLTAGFTSGIGNLINLTYLTLTSNPLNSPLPTELSNLTNLETLVLSNNGHTGPLTPIANLTKLKGLSMSNNNFNNPLPSTIGNLSGLILMNFYNSKIIGTLPSSIGLLTKLRGLDLSYNQLTGTLHSSMTGLIGLSGGINSLPSPYISYDSSTIGNGRDHSAYAGLKIDNNQFDRDLSNNAIIPSSLISWHSGLQFKSIASQTDLAAPIIAGAALAGTYSFDVMSYTVNLTESSSLLTSGMVLTVGGGGTCSQLTVSGSLTNGMGDNIVQLKFAAGSNATTAYSNCTLRTVDRAGNLSNILNLGNFSVELQPYPVCNNVSLTIPQNECTALMDFYTNLGGSGWTNKTGRGTDPNINNRFGVTINAGRVQQLKIEVANNLVGSISNVFSNLTGLTVLSIAGNNGVVGSFPASISNLPGLTSLTINNTNIVGLLPSILPTSLTSVSINNNPALTSGPLPSSWNALTNLTYLSLQNNNLNGALPSSWSSLTKLTYFHLGSNNFNSQIPSSWLTSLTGVGQMAWGGANIDGPLPVELLNWNTNVSYPYLDITNNCFGTGHLTSAQINSFDAKWTRAKWATQKKCTTDLSLSVTPSGNLTTSNSMLYTFTVTNNGARWAYAPQVTTTLLGGLQAEESSNLITVFDSLAPGASQTKSITVIKTATSPTTQTSITNTFVLSDETIVDSLSSNNTITNVQAVKASTKSYCNHYALSTSITQCEALGDLHTSTNGTSWTNKTNWTITPNTDTWFGVTTSIDDDLIAHYTFDANNAIDDAGNGYTGTLVASPTFATGRITKGIVLNGSSQRVNLPTTTNLSPGNITLSARLYRTSTGVNQGIIRKNSAYALSLFNDRIQVAPGNSWSFRNTNITVPLQQWIHITWTYDGSIMRVYKNGVQEWTQSLVGALPTTNTSTPFIGYDDNGRWWGGVLDDVRIYGRAITASEVTQLYQSSTIIDNITKVCMSNSIESTSCNYSYQGVVGNNLVGTLPSSLSGLTELTWLSLNKNSITGTLPISRSTLNKLTYFGIDSNNISGTIPTSWGGMTNLSQLAISYNPNLGGAIPSQLTSTKLNTIWGENNSFTSLPDLSALNWGQIQLGGNQFSGPLPSWIGTEGGLTWLRLNNNNFSGPIPTTRGGLQSLQYFYLNNNTNLTGNFDVMSGLSLSNLNHFVVNNNNFDRDSSNSAFVPTNVTARIPSMSVYNVSTQGDTTAPILSSSSTIPSTIDGSFSYVVNFNEGSSTTGVGFASGLAIMFTGSTKCATKLAVNPSYFTTKGNTTLEIAALESGQYAECKIYTVDRAGLQSNLLALTTFIASDYGICNIVSDITTNDCKSLVDLYNSTNGAEWINNTNWKGIGDATSTTACDWYGVKCSAGRVWRLFLGGKENPTDQACDWGDHPGNNLVGTLSDSIGNLTGLTSLCLPNNKLTGSLPSTIGNITPLWAISLWGNQFSGATLPSQWGNLSSLAYLILRTSGVGGSLPASWSGMTNMYMFSAYGNSLNGSLPSSWSTMTNLRYLHLYTNSLSGLLPASWGSMSNMDTLYLYNNSLSGPLPPEWSNMSNLRILYLNDNNLSGPIPSNWGQLVKLARLYLNNNNLRGLIPESLTNNPTRETSTMSNISNNCLSTSTSYMSAGLSNLLTSKFITSPQKNCTGTIGSRVWNDTNNNGMFDSGETGPSGITATLRSCTDQLPVNVADNLLDHQLVVRYTFDDSTATDLAGGDNNGAIINMSFANSRVGKGISNNSSTSSSYVTHSTQGLSSTNGTIALWVNPNTISPWGIRQTYDSSGLNRLDRISMFNYSSSVLYYRMGNGTSCCSNDLTINPTTYFTPGLWYHLVFTWEGDADGVADDTMRIYINGNLVASRSSASFQSNIAPVARVGYGHGRALDGNIDEFRAYSRALSASEINQLYQSTIHQVASNIPISYNGTSVTSITSSTSGNYAFTNITPGKYYIEYTTIPLGYKFTTQNFGGGVNPGNSDVNPWSAKTSCFELYNGLNEFNIDAGLKYLPYSSCESTASAYTPTLVGQPVTLSIGGYGTNGQVQAINASGLVVLNQSITNQGSDRGLKTRTYNWTPGSIGTYTLSGAVDGYNYKLDYYNNASLGVVSCAYRTISEGNRCAVQSTVTPYSTTLTNVNQIATIPSPIGYCTTSQNSTLPCSTAGNQPTSMVVQVPNTCVSTLTITDDLNVMCDNITDMQSAECKALISLYDATAGSSWTTKTNWKFAGDTTPRTACDWHGITCAGGRVTQINITNNNIIGTIPALTGLNMLSTLNLATNQLTGALSISWPTTLTSLTTLNLGSNNINGSLPTQWSTWSSIRTITINDNKLTGTLPTSWSSLVNIGNIGIRNNQITGTLPTSWSAMTKLTYLGLHINNLNGTLPTSWSSMNMLATLHLGDNNLSGQVPLVWFTGMTSLQGFYWSGVTLDGPMPIEMMNWNVNAGYAFGRIDNNCLGTTNISGAFLTWLNTRLPNKRQNQKICQTDLQLSLLSKEGSLYSGNSMTYTLSYKNVGSRWSYDTKVGLSMLAGLGVVTGSSTTGVTTTGINLGILAPGTSGTLTFVINKGNLTGGLYNSTQVFTISDSTIADTVSSNNSYTDPNVQVLTSSSPVCNNADLTIPLLECETLMTVYQTMNGSNWINKTGRGTDPNVNNRFGITVVGGYVDRISFGYPNNNLVGPLPTNIDNFTQLRTLIITYQTGVVGQFPSSIGNLTKLTQLEIYKNGFTGPIPSSIGNLTGLTILYFGGGYTQGVNTGFTSYPSSLSNLTKLKTLVIMDSYMSGSLPMLTGFNVLEGISFRNQNFTGGLPSSRGDLPNLKTINVDTNLLEGYIPASYQNLTDTLEKFYIGNNKLDGPIPEWLSGFTLLN